MNYFSNLSSESLLSGGGIPKIGNNTRLISNDHSPTLERGHITIRDGDGDETFMPVPQRMNQDLPSSLSKADYMASLQTKYTNVPASDMYEAEPSTNQGQF